MVAIERHGGPNVTGSSNRWVKRGKRDEMLPAPGCGCRHLSPSSINSGAPAPKE